MIFWCVFGVLVMILDDVFGICFVVWVFDVQCVLVIGDFNVWDYCCYLMICCGVGVWEIFVFGVQDGVWYKFSVVGVDGQ